ncbi:MAG TPA: hypothetical protein VLS90_04270, partial [Thermodesulfobacteriota bacterium]|nr:hypothetical protein [Thermodesulfobacteriota bacterium]
MNALLALSIALLFLFFPVAAPAQHQHGGHEGHGSAPGPEKPGAPSPAAGDEAAPRRAFLLENNLKAV